MDIRFRGKRTSNGDWIYGSLYLSKSWVAIQDQSISVCWDEFIEVDPATVGQFTGLRDKAGREIYEGDIVVQDGYKWFDDGKPNYVGTVEWIYSQWQVVAHCVNHAKRGISDGINEGLNDEGFGEGENSPWEVIGNIWDNPALLTKCEG